MRRWWEIVTVFFLLYAMVGSWQPAAGGLHSAVSSRQLAGIVIKLPDTLSVCKTCKVSSIREAIKLAKPGDVLVIGTGEYREGTILIDKPLEIVGRDNPQVFGNDTCDIFLVRSDYVSITGLIIRDIGHSYVKDLAGVKLDRVKHAVIRENKLYNTFFGIYLKNSDSCLVEKNEIHGQARDEISSGNAIHLWYSKNIVLSGNFCHRHRDGIYLEFADHCLITGNHSWENVRYGLHFMFSNHDEYTGNTFDHNGAGVAVMFSRYISMKGNAFEHNWGPSSYGLLLKDIFDGEISGNIFRQNTFGIYADGSNRIHVQGNRFEANGWALKILGSCSDNTFTRNDFIGNSFDIITNTSSNTNIYRGNFWSDYSGYDLDRDGTGDVPYRPVKLFSYIVGNLPSSIILLRSFFVDLVNFAEKVAPSITPEALVDPSPLMKPVAP